MHLEPNVLRRRLQSASPPSIAGPPAEQQAAVFVVLVNRGPGETSAILIRRADRGDPWSGQIAFPGGRIDPGDADALSAAYRETQEEIGLPAEVIQLVGSLGCFRTQTRPVDLHAFLGWWGGGEPLRPDPREVEEVLEVTAADLVDAHLRAGFSGKPTSVLGDALIYTLADRNVWGVTARILHHLCEQVFGQPRLPGP